MKILRLDLRAFGPFTDLTLDLSAGSEGLHVIYGPNEAGKSSSLRALEQMLFGIPSRSTDDFLHSYQNLRIGATLGMAGKPPIAFLRRKGAKNTLLAPDNTTPLDEALLKPFLGGLDRDMFQSMFGIGHAKLVHGGNEIVNGSGNVGQVLFAAGAGIADLQQVQSHLESQAAELYLPRGQTRRINQHLKALDEARRRIRQAQLPSDEWVQHDQALREARERCAQLEAELAKRQSEKNRLERISRALPVIAKRKELLRQLEDLGKVTLLPADFADKRRETVTRLAVASKAEQTAREELERAQREMQAIEVPEAILARADEIERLPDELGSFRKAHRDLPGLSARREQLLRETAVVLHQVRPDLALEEADRLRLTGLQQMTIQKLGNRHAALVERLQQSRDEIRQTENDLAELTGRLGQLEAPRDPGPLKDAVRRTQNQGELEAQLAEASARLDNLQRKAAIEIKRLPLWSGSLEDLERLALPGNETVQRFGTQLIQAQREFAKLREGLEDSQRRRAEVEREYEILQLEGEVPSEEDLAEARRVRDLGWRLVVQAWQQGNADPKELEAFLGRFSGSPDLAAAYQESVETADELADRLRREANRVAQRAALMADRHALDRQLDKLGQEAARAEEEQRRIEQAWIECWRPAGIAPLTPQEMVPWLGQHRNLLQQAEAIRAQQAVVDLLRDRVQAHRCELLKCLEALDASQGSREEGRESLVAVLQRSQAVLDRIESCAERRAQLQRDAQKLNAALAAAQTKAAKAEAELAQWQDQWATAIEPLGLSPETAPEVAVHVLNEILKLLAGLKDARELADRIDAIGRDAEDFARRARRLASEACPDLASRPAEQAAEQLILRSRKAMNDRQKRDELAQKLRRYQAEQEKARRGIEELTARLNTMCREAGCTRADELPEAERASESALRLRERLQAVEDQLAASSGGAGIESFIAQAEAESADRLPGQLAQLEEEVHRFEAERDELQRTIGGESKLLAAMDGNADAADAAEEVQDLLARIEADAAQYVRLQLAKAVLREGIERYRKKAEGPVLRRAGELFRRLTRGSFVGLAVDFNEQGQSVLKGVRPEQGTSVELSGMSEGTADQLYLAMRLASLESYLDGKEPIPFVVDDVLISFDDDRALTALEVLAEFSQRAQVIFFTHHAHLVQLAQEHLDAGVLFVHNL